MIRALIERILFYLRARRKAKEIAQHTHLYRPMRPADEVNMFRVGVQGDGVVLQFPQPITALVLGEKQTQLLLDALIRFKEEKDGV